MHFVHRISRGYRVIHKICGKHKLGDLRATKVQMDVWLCLVSRAPPNILRVKRAAPKCMFATRAIRMGRGWDECAFGISRLMQSMLNVSWRIVKAIRTSKGRSVIVMFDRRSVGSVAFGIGVKIDDFSS